MSDYVSRAELLKEINLAEWKDERDKAEAHYIATHLEPACIIVQKQTRSREEVSD